MTQAVKKIIQTIALTLGVCCILACVVLAIAHVSLAQQELVDSTPVENTFQFDISALEAWYHEEDLGTVRMIGAWVHEREGDVWTLYDEQGNAWTVEDLHNMQQHGWMLLWIADNHTTEDTTDDVIVKLWTEVY